MTGTISH